MSTYAPDSIRAAMAVWTRNGGVNLGIVGDTAHLVKGTSYHLGRDDLLSTAYSIQLARDRAGLTNAASAMDLGKLAGTYGALRAFSRWLVERTQQGAPGTGDIREIIWSPDGTMVRRWDNYLKRDNLGGDGTGQGDNSHRYHTHVSFYRDSENRDKTGIFTPYFPDQPADPGGQPMAKFTAAIIPSGAWLYTYHDYRPDSNNINVDPGRPMIVASRYGDGSLLVVHDNTGRSVFARPGLSLVELITPDECPAPPADTSPFTQADIDAAVAAALAQVPAPPPGTIDEEAIKAAEKERIAQALSAHLRSLLG